MSRRVDRLSVDLLAELPPEVRACVVWELDPVERARAERDGTCEDEKRAWLSLVLLEWGSCGRVLVVDDEPVGVVAWAPPAYLPGSVAMPTAPVSDDAVQLGTVWVAPEHRGGGLGRVLLRLAAKDVARRGGFRALECFGRTSEVAARQSEDDGCLPVEFLQRVGFRTARAHPRQPRMRLDLRATVSWREEVEQAWERLRDVVRAPKTSPTPSPAPRSTPPPSQRLWS